MGHKIMFTFIVMVAFGLVLPYIALRVALDTADQMDYMHDRHEDDAR